ncbi:MAG: hypothetical protein KR126chlam2_00440 [Chlamydiae bacterium]|nr:hypothetical protein [Chlamydiota bacterium]
MEIIRESPDSKDWKAKLAKREEEQISKAMERKGAKTEAEWQKSTLEALKMQQSRHPRVKLSDHRIKVNPETEAVKRVESQQAEELEKDTAALLAQAKASEVAKRALPKVVMGKMPGTTPGSAAAGAA